MSKSSCKDICERLKIVKGCYDKDYRTLLEKHEKSIWGKNL